MHHSQVTTSLELAAANFVGCVTSCTSCETTVYCVYMIAIWHSPVWSMTLAVYLLYSGN